MKKPATALVVFVALEHILFVQGAPALAALVLVMLGRPADPIAKA